MPLVYTHAPSIPVPMLHGSHFRFNKGKSVFGEITMDFVPGKTLRSVWGELGHDDDKYRICRDLWNIIDQIRTIPCPEGLAESHYRTADGSPSRDYLLGTGTDYPPPTLDDQTLRERIASRFEEVRPFYQGFSYQDTLQLLEDLPMSSVSVFTHGDLWPGNIIVNERYCIVAILDWESAGWFPDYWEYSQMMRASADPAVLDWQDWTKKTRPMPWDLKAFDKVRQVVF